MHPDNAMLYAAFDDGGIPRLAALPRINGYCCRFHPGLFHPGLFHPGLVCCDSAAMGDGLVYRLLDGPSVMVSTSATSSDLVDL
ncbi:hypothetical protein G3M48_005632, partial [Beauveria asiatica]